VGTAVSDAGRLLPVAPLRSLGAYLDHGGAGLVGARHIGSAEILAEIDAAGLRGRGGAGFPAVVKRPDWTYDP
jgi:NADH:ubiquinone oxidoreductase subunit F (NADH-binding)